MLDNQTTEQIDIALNQAAEGIPETMREDFESEIASFRETVIKTVELILSHGASDKPDIEAFVKSKVKEWIEKKKNTRHYLRYCKLMKRLGKEPKDFRSFGHRYKVPGQRKETRPSILGKFLQIEQKGLDIGDTVKLMGREIVGEISGIAVDGNIIVSKDGVTIKGTFHPKIVEKVESF